MSESIGISLGYRCCSAQLGVDRSFRKRKNQGYLTCPFDYMLTNYIGLLQCLRDDFSEFCNPDMLEIIESYPNEWPIHHKKYGFWFSHESPIGDIYLRENWEFGKNHFVENNYARFIERYQKRIQNFRQYLAADDPKNKILFIIERFNKPPTELEALLMELYPNLDFTILWFSHDEVCAHIEKFYAEKHFSNGTSPMEMREEELARFEREEQAWQVNISPHIQRIPGPHWPTPT